MRSSPPQRHPSIFQQPQVITFPLKVKQREPINFASCQLTRKVNKKMMIFLSGNKLYNSYKEVLKKEKIVMKQKEGMK